MQSCRDALSKLTLKEGTHAGLLLQRYLHSLAKDDAKDDAHIESRNKLLKAVVASVNKEDTIKFYRIAYERWENSIPGGTKKDVQIKGRMVIGLSSESPLETGLCLHHTYGTPIIPGSALKGLASHYCQQVWGWKSDNKYFQTLFGTTEEMGCICFYDAMIKPESLKDSLVRDVMTVHHEDYYGNGKSAPSDYDDPNPVTFLSVQGKFTIVVKCTVADEAGKKWEELALQLLLDALDQYGIGGKTSSGYGRIKECEANSKEKD